MDKETYLSIIAVSLLVPCILIAIRLLQILPSSHLGKTSSKIIVNDNIKGKHIMILLGSGGHTGEMMNILSNIDLKNFNRIWVASSGDSTSLQKAQTYEEKLEKTKYSTSFMTLYRARKVGESIPSSIISTIKSLISTFTSLLTLPHIPSIVLLNGPGTCVPLAYSLFVLKFFGLAHTKIIYIESLARVNNLSLSGKLLLPISDRFIVQWEKLSLKYQRAEYYGILV
ncbi:UDP-N-acetylglucosamine transferase subunit ALG14 [Scheffersomyces coipomensis]|uniref:UDP-N-acetylglucosamine transferase subunit ALG14 n=1 Tax=Scheffersomyces coipomensis TaxID=1788519 RepID=UPI00315D48FA